MCDVAATSHIGKQEGKLMPEWEANAAQRSNHQSTKLVILKWPLAKALLEGS